MEFWWGGQNENSITEVIADEGECRDGVNGAAGSDSAERCVPTETAQTIQNSFTDPVEVGLDKLSNSTWLRDTLDRVETDDLKERETSDCTNDPNSNFDPTYELHHVD